MDQLLGIFHPMPEASRQNPVSSHDFLTPTYYLLIIMFVGSQLIDQTSCIIKLKG